LKAYQTDAWPTIETILGLESRRNLKQDTEYEEILVRYLLGQMTEEEQQQVEERYIGHDEFFERLLVVEDELIDRYVRDQLSDQEREHFERYFLSTPTRRKRMEFAETLNYYSSRPDKNIGALPAISPAVSRAALGTPIRSAFWMAVAAALIMALSISWLLVDRAQLKREIEQTNALLEEAERERQELHQSAERDARDKGPLQRPDEQVNPGKQIAPDRPSDQQPSIGIVSLVLTPGLVRGGGEVKKVVITPQTQSVILKVKFAGEEYKSYQVVISTVEGREVYNQVWVKEKVNRKNKTIKVVVPAGLFSEQDYTLKLSGVTATGDEEYIGEYFFRAARK
jgi:hypothetical protein